MPDFIDRKTTIRELNETYEREFPTANGAFDYFATKVVPFVIRSIPASKVEPVRHGKWKCSYFYTFQYFFECSSCRKTFSFPSMTTSPYCPNCGARMDGDSNA